MAGDWMKIELSLPDKPEVFRIATITGLDPDAVVGKLIRVWQWFNNHTTDGNAFGVTFALVDRITNVTGFGEAMMLAGWLEQNDIILKMPKFERHTSESAKKRALTSERVAKHRSKSNEKSNAESVTKTLPEKRREEKKVNTSSSSDDDVDTRFATFWKAYPKKIGKGAAEKAWKKLHINGDFNAVLAAIEAQKQSEQWQRDGGQFIPHPATWLNQKRWLDEVTPASNSSEYAELRKTLFRGAI